MAFDFALPVASLISGGLGAIGSVRTANTQANIANEQMRAQADALRQNILMQRDQAKAQLGAGMFGSIFGATTAEDLNLARQLGAQRAQFGEFMPKQFGLEREGAAWETAFKADPLYRKQSRQERIGRLQENIAGLRAQPTGMFGRIAQAPIESLMV